MNRLNFASPPQPVIWHRRIAEHLDAIPPGNPARDLELIRTLAMGYRLTEFMDIQRARVLLRGARNEWDIVTCEGQTALIKALEQRTACASNG